MKAIEHVVRHLSQFITLHKDGPNCYVLKSVFAVVRFEKSCEPKRKLMHYVQQLKKI